MAKGLPQEFAVGLVFPCAFDGTHLEAAKVNSGDLNCLFQLPRALSFARDRTRFDTTAVAALAQALDATRKRETRCPHRQACMDVGLYRRVIVPSSSNSYVASIGYPIALGASVVQAVAPGGARRFLAA